MKRTLSALVARLNGHFLGRVLTATVVLLATFPCYFWINNHTTPKVDFYTPLDAALPFWPWTLPIYESYYLLILGAAWVCRAEEFLRTLGAVLLANFIAYAFFFTLTAHYPRPDPATVEIGWIRANFEYMFAHDAPGNTFPSLHVTVTWLLTLRLYQRRFGLVWLAWGSLISLSTLTVKQHFVVDVIAGVALATALNAWLLKGRPLRAAAAPAPAKTE